MTAIVAAPMNPAEPSGARRHGPASATAAITPAQARPTP